MTVAKPIPFIFRLHDGNLFTLPALFNIIEEHPGSDGFALTAAHSLDEVINEIGAAQQAVVAYSFMTPHLRYVMDETAALKSRFGSRITLIGGGSHLVGAPEHGPAMGFDAVSAGEGESTLPAMLTDFWDGGFDLPCPIYYNGPKPHSLDGTQNRYRLIQTGDVRMDLDKSFPICRTLPMMSPLEITRGCHWHCDFCQTSCVRPMHRSLESVERYLEELVRRDYLFRAGFIAPSGFEYGADRPGICRLDMVEAVLSRFKSAGVKHLEYGIFPSELRPNTVSSEGLRLITTYASNKKVTIGAQSGSDAVLKRFRRGHNTVLIEEATALTREAGLTPMLDFIVGFPGETDEERHATLELARHLNNRYHARTQMHFFLPLSGTPLEEAAPSFFGPEMEAFMMQSHRDGVSTLWWQEGMKRSREIVEIQAMLANKCENKG